MPIKLKVAALEEVDEADRGLYKQVGTEFVFAPDDYKEIAETVFAPGLKSALEKERDDRKKKGEALAKYDGLGDPDEIRKVLAERQKKALEKADKEKDYESLKAQLTSEFEKERNTLNSQIKTLTGDLESTTIDADITQALLDEGGRKRLLYDSVRRQVKLLRDEKTGKLVTRVMMPDGETVRIGGADGSPMTVRQLVAAMKQEEDFAPAFDAVVKEGISGAPGKMKEAPAGSIRSRKDFKSDAEKVAFITKHGYDAFEALPLG